jgi:hypothetical protein
MADFVTAVSGNAQPPQLQPISFVFNAGALGLGLLKTPDRVRLDVITVDATMQETHTFEADITEHPVEQGANITDHIRPKLKHYSIDGIISNTPIGPTGDLSDALHTGALALGVTLPTFPTSYDADLARSAGSTTRAKAVFEKLIALMDAAETITIHTPLKDYASMALESISVVRDQHLSSGAIRFQGGLQGSAHGRGAEDRDQRAARFRAAKQGPRYPEPHRSVRQDQGACRLRHQVLHQQHRLDRRAEGLMATVIIPTRNDGTQRYSIRGQLGQRYYGFELRWNARDASWNFVLSDATGTVLASEKMVVGVALTVHRVDDRLPHGELIAVDSSDDDLDPGSRISVRGSFLPSRTRRTSRDGADRPGRAAHDPERRHSCRW